MKLRNISPLGRLDVAGLGVVDAGEEFEVVDSDLAAALLAQSDNFVSAVPMRAPAPAPEAEPEPGAEAAPEPKPRRRGRADAEPDAVKEA